MSSVLAGVLPAGVHTVGWGNLFGGKAERESIGDQHVVGQASALQGPVSDLQMSGHASELPPSTGPAECWLSDSVVQARNRLFAYLNGQQVGIGDGESKEEWWPTPNEGDHTSDLIPIGCDDNRTTDINDTLMLTGISGSVDLQRQIKALNVEYGDIFSTTVRAETAKVHPLSIKKPRYILKRNSGAARFLTRYKDVDLRKRNGTVGIPWRH